MDVLYALLALVTAIGPMVLVWVLLAVAERKHAPGSSKRRWVE